MYELNTKVLTKDDLRDPAKDKSLDELTMHDFKKVDFELRLFENADIVLYKTENDQCIVLKDRYNEKIFNEVTELSEYTTSDLKAYLDLLYYYYKMMVDDLYQQESTTNMENVLDMLDKIEAELQKRMNKLC